MGRLAHRAGALFQNDRRAGQKRMATVEKSDDLAILEKRLAAYNLRGQWQADGNRPQKVGRGADGQVSIEPLPAGTPHIWQWAKMQPLLEGSLEALSESYTARRTLVLCNPTLPRGTTQTMVASIQIIRPGELAWAHRHTINAIRFAIQGGPQVSTVVDGEPLIMEPYDLLLTPGWSWHDHHNQSDKPAIWLDALDVPFTLALNQNFYEEFGESAQEHTGVTPPSAPIARMTGNATRAGARPMRYAWADMLKSLKAAASGKDPAISPVDGIMLEYINPLTGGSVLPTLSCRVQWLPPGFVGEKTRRTSSAIHFVVQGAGRTVFDDQELAWTKHDAIVAPNWGWHQHINASPSEPAILFTITDVPILQAFGLYREETRPSNK
jgi:1-hydroxy-2-naphthoate dioxygenase